MLWNNPVKHAATQGVKSPRQSPGCTVLERDSHKSRRDILGLRPIHQLKCTPRQRKERNERRHRTTHWSTEAPNGERTARNNEPKATTARRHEKRRGTVAEEEPLLSSRPHPHRSTQGLRRRSQGVHGVGVACRPQRPKREPTPQTLQGTKKPRSKR